MAGRRQGNAARAVLLTTVATSALLIAAATAARAQSGPAQSSQPWDGLYAGMAFGPGWLKANTSAQSHTVTTQTTTQSTGTVATSTTTTDALASASGSGNGAQADFFLGHNFRPGGNWVTSLQVEGSLAHDPAGLGVTQTSVLSQVLVTRGPPTTQTTIGTSVFTDALQQRWALSALGRVGWLIDPRDLVYAIGGYTYGGFGWGSRTFGLNGASIGGGWEREIAPGWTLKAEYRYTRFEDKDLPRSSASASTSTSISGTGAVTTNVINTAAAFTDRVSGLDLHTLRFGLTYQFGADAGAFAFASAPTAFVTKAPPLVAPYSQSWDGLYAGVSFGPSRLKAATSSQSHAGSSSTTTSSTRTVQTTSITNDSAGSASGSNWGAQSDLYVGYNFRLGGNLVAGLQLEGTIANSQTQLNATQAQLSNTVTTTTPPGTTTSNSSPSTATFIDTLQQRWAVSALGRLGWLLDPRDLVYVVGGYSYAGFDWNGRLFELSGASIGAGWERAIAPGWTLKAEYRYTRFQDKDLPSASATGSSQISTGPFATTTLVGNSTTVTTDRVSGLDLHALRIGATYHFGAEGPAVVSANAAMVTKAPPLAAAPAWTGLYGGAAFGLTTMRLGTATTSNDVTNLTNVFPGVSEVSAQTVNTAASTGGQRGGALADLFAGYNLALGSNLIGGVQLEGGIAHAGVRGSGPISQSTMAVTVNTPAGVPASTTTLNQLVTGTALFNVESRWIASALARLGFLIDPRDLVYGIGGWSYGGFAAAQAFTMNGPTIGAGIEHAVAPSWTLKAEYRYTHFRSRDLATPTTSVTNTPGTTTFFAFTGVLNQADRIAVDMHAVRFGVTHYFASN